MMDIVDAEFRRRRLIASNAWVTVPHRHQWWWVVRRSCTVIGWCVFATVIFLGSLYLAGLVRIDL